MIKYHFTFKEEDLTIEVNWTKSVIPCKKVKIKLGKEQIILDRDKFFILMALFADDTQLENMTQRVKTNFVSIERMLKLKTDKDIKKGEYIVFPYVYWIPENEYNELKKDGEMVKLVKKNTKTLKEVVANNEAAKKIKELWEKGKLEIGR